MMSNESEIGAARRRRESATGVAVVDTPSPTQALRSAQVQPGPESDHQGKGGVPDVHVFTLAFTDSRGHLWSGEFRTHILSIRERVQVGLTKSKLAVGLPPEALDPYTATILEMQAHLAVSLDAAPQWAKNLDQIRDVAVLQAIYQEVASHEARFFGTGGGDAVTEDDR